MPRVEFTARKISSAAEEGINRLKHYRNARAMFIKDYVGNYFAKPKGLTGQYPVNLVFLAIRALIPNLVMKHGINKVTTEILAYKDFAEMLGLGLDVSQRQRKLKKILRAGLVDMCFGMAIYKTSIWASGELLPVGDDVNVDPGQIYTDLVDIDDFVLDPTCRSLEEATMMGHVVRIPRYKLLEQDFNEELIMSLPTADPILDENGKVEELSKMTEPASAMAKLQDYVKIVELWIPEAEAICYVPHPAQTTKDKFLKVTDYYGPAEGPYTIGSLTPPVPNNPLPVAPVGVWRDLNEMANRMFRKFMEQGDRQKDVLLYRPQYADDAEAIRTAVDGDCIATDNPNDFNSVSFGGQSTDNEKMISQLRSWFNYMAGNPDQMSGVSSSATTNRATEVQMLQANASVVTEDMRDIIADVNADISKKEAWFMMHDPLINIPASKRISGGREVQIWLTPEQRQGDHSEYFFKIKKRSMQIQEPHLRSKAIMEFFTNVLPSVMTSAQISMQIGVPFNASRALMQAAEELGIEDLMVEVFDDPTFARRLEMFQRQGPQDSGKGQIVNPKAVAQNNGFPMAHSIAGPQTDFNRNAQQTAAMGQAAFGAGGGL
ncbi:MAG: hypothetical protein DRH17_13940 [Deltaproteobacteria bacterium]|nr:MAG: hypothetical protein DRH17_13940 [Deltaproteobacteria bacterium]